MRPLTRSLGINLIGVGLVAITGFVSVLMMARWLETAQFGTLSLLLLMFNSIAILDGVRPVLVLLGSRSDDFGRLVRTAEVTMTLAGSAVACLSMIALACAGWAHVGIAHAILFSLALGMYFPLSAYWGLLDSQGETAFTGALRSVAWILVYIAFAALAWLNAGLTPFVVAMSLMNGGLLAVYRVRLYDRYARSAGAVDWNLVRRIRRDALDNLIFNASAFVMASVDRFALGLLRGPTELGLYAGVYELTTKPAAFLRVLAAVLFPEAARMQDTIKLRELLFPVLKSLFFVVTCGVFVSVMYRSKLVLLVLGEKFVDVADSFGLLCIGFALLSVGHIVAVPIQAGGDFKRLGAYYSATACLMVVLIWPAIALGGSKGAAMTYLASRLVDVALLLAACRQLKHPVSFAKASLVSLLFCWVMLAAWYGFAAVGILGLAALAFSIRVPQFALKWISAGPLHN
jgi:O-antigen/teichoic acid export membrane protein